MKEWFKKFDKAIIALLLFVVTYIIMCSISTNYIHFDNNNRYSAQSRSEYERRAYHSQNEHNVKVARFYFLQLPFGAAVPSLLYLLSAFFIQKKNDKRNADKDNHLVNCLIRAKNTIPSNGIQAGLRKFTYEEYWEVISRYPDSALQYMLTHPNEFYIADQLEDKPSEWEKYVCETIYINGVRYYIYMRSKQFVADLDNCVREILQKQS